MNQSTANPPLRNDPCAIDGRGLTLRFGHLTAVGGVDLQVPYGVIFGLLGANGAGKTSIIKMRTTLLPPTSGSASVAGYDISTSPHEVRKRIGYVPQMLSADGALTGYENLLLSRAIQPVLWLTVFGQVLSHVRGIDTGKAGYLAFMTPGILAQSVLFSAIFYGIAVIWERDLGIVHKLLVSPASRWLWARHWPLTFVVSFKRR